MPHEFSVALYREMYSSATAAAAPLVTYFGLTEFLGDIPGYQNDLYNIWKLCRVTRADVTITIQSTGVPLKAALGWCAYSDYSNYTSTPGTAVALIAQGANSVRGSTGPSTGDTKLVLRRSYDPYELLGQFIPGRYYSMTFAQAASVTPIDTQEPIFVFAIDSVDGTSVRSYTYEMRITFHTQWHDLRQSTAN